MTVTLSDITCNETIQAMIKKGQYWHNISPQYGSKHKVVIYICRYFIAHFKVLSAKQSTDNSLCIFQTTLEMWFSSSFGHASLKLTSVIFLVHSYYSFLTVKSTFY